MRPQYIGRGESMNQVCQSCFSCNLCVGCPACGACIPCMSETISPLGYVTLTSATLVVCYLSFVFLLDQDGGAPDA